MNPLLMPDSESTVSAERNLSILRDKETIFPGVMTRSELAFLTHAISLIYIYLTHISGFDSTHQVGRSKLLNSNRRVHCLCLIRSLLFPKERSLRPFASVRGNNISW